MSAPPPNRNTTPPTAVRIAYQLGSTLVRDTAIAVANAIVAVAKPITVNAVTEITWSPPAIEGLWSATRSNSAASIVVPRNPSPTVAIPPPKATEASRTSPALRISAARLPMNQRNAIAESPSSTVCTSPARWCWTK